MRERKPGVGPKASRLMVCETRSIESALGGMKSAGGFSGSPVNSQSTSGNCPQPAVPAKAAVLLALMNVRRFRLINPPWVCEVVGVGVGAWFFALSRLQESECVVGGLPGGSRLRAVAWAERIRMRLCEVPVGHCPDFGYDYSSTCFCRVIERMHHNR